MSTQVPFRGLRHPYQPLPSASLFSDSESPSSPPAITPSLTFPLPAPNSNTTDSLHPPLRSAPASAVPFLRSTRFTQTLLPTAQTLAVVYNLPPTQIMEEFRRFLAIKVLLADGMANKVSPTGLMDEMWHVAILDTVFYGELQRALGMAIHHRPEGEREGEERMTRLGVLERVYGDFFGSSPLSEPAPSTQPLSGTTSHDQRDPTKESYRPHRGQRLFVHTHTGRIITVDMNSETTVYDLKSQIEYREGIEVDQQRLLHRGKELMDGRSLNDYGVRPEDDVWLTLRLRGC